MLVAPLLFISIAASTSEISESPKLLFTALLHCMRLNNSVGLKECVFGPELQERQVLILTLENYWFFKQNCYPCS